jgi:RsiW-degrading membrane proteinase PrsW (M82 family)
MTRMFLGRPVEIVVFAAMLGFLIGGVAAATLYYNDVNAKPGTS